MSRTAKLAVLGHRVHTARLNAESLLTTDAYERPNSDEERALIADIAWELGEAEKAVERLREVFAAHTP